MICIPAQRAERIRHGVAALQQGVQAVRLLLQELNSLHLHPQHHSHLALQAGELVCMAGRQNRGEDGENDRQGETDGRREESACQGDVLR